MLLDELANELPDFASSGRIQLFAQLHELLTLCTADTNQQLTVFLVGFHFSGFISHERAHTKKMTSQQGIYLHCIYIIYHCQMLRGGCLQASLANQARRSLGSRPVQ